MIPHRLGPAWLADVVNALAVTGDAVVVEVVTGNGGMAPATAKVGRALLRVYGWIDGRVFGRQDDPTQIVDIVTAVDRSLADGPARSSSAADPELVIRLDGGSDRIARWPAPTFGVWTMAHGMGLPAGVRPEPLGLDPSGPEMLLGRPYTISQLIAHVGDEHRIINQAVSRVDPLSLRRGARGHLRKMPGLVAGAVSALSTRGEIPPAVVEPLADAANLGRATLGSTRIAGGLTKILAGYVLRYITRKVAPGRWAIAISRERDDPRASTGNPFQFLQSPEDREWADPFPLRTPKGDLLFVEEYVYANHRGRLAVVELDDSPRGWRSVETILDLPTHLSYPFFFEWAGAWYLLPEQAATGKLQLYVAEAFPLTWRWHSTALDRGVSDATIIEIDGLWWMFAAMSVAGGIATDELHLFHAQTPLGPWTAHTHNPVVSDVRSARPAGRLFQRDGAWYRVAQDGAVTYGHSIVVARIDRLDLDEYRETVVDVIRPDWAPGLMATHTLNRDAGLTVIDANGSLRRRRR